MPFDVDARVRRPRASRAPTNVGRRTPYHRSDTAPCADDLLDFRDQRRRRPHADLRRHVGPDTRSRSARSAVSISNDTPAIAAMAREDLAERLEHAAIGRLPHADRHLARQPLAHACRSARSPTPASRTDSSSRSSLPRTSTIVPVSIRARRALIRLGKRDHLDAALRVFEREDRHAVALARLQLAAGGDDAADAGVGLDRLAAARPPARRRARAATGCVGELGRSTARRSSRSALGVPIDRMAAPVQAERFLFEPELLGLGPRRRLPAAAIRRRPGSGRAIA